PLLTPLRSAWTEDVHADLFRAWPTSSLVLPEALLVLRLKHHFQPECISQSQQGIACRITKATFDTTNVCLLHTRYFCQLRLSKLRRLTCRRHLAPQQLPAAELRFELSSESFRQIMSFGTPICTCFIGNILKWTSRHVGLLILLLLYYVR